MQALAKLDAAAATPLADSDLVAALPTESSDDAVAETAAPTALQTEQISLSVPPELHEGCSVSVHGLQARPDLNGSRCGERGVGLAVSLLECLAFVWRYNFFRLTRILAAASSVAL